MKAIAVAVFSIMLFSAAGASAEFVGAHVGPVGVGFGVHHHHHDRHCWRRHHHRVCNW